MCKTRSPVKDNTEQRVEGRFHVPARCNEHGFYDAFIDVWEGLYQRGLRLRAWTHGTWRLGRRCILHGRGGCVRCRRRCRGCGRWLEAVELIRRRARLVRHYEQASFLWGCRRCRCLMKPPERGWVRGKRSDPWSRRQDARGCSPSSQAPWPPRRAFPTPRKGRG